MDIAIFGFWVVNSHGAPVLLWVSAISLSPPLLSLFCVLVALSVGVVTVAVVTQCIATWRRIQSRAWCVTPFLFFFVTSLSNGFFCVFAD